MNSINQFPFITFAVAFNSSPFFTNLILFLSSNFGDDFINEFLNGSLLFRSYF